MKKLNDFTLITPSFDTPSKSLLEIFRALRTSVIKLQFNKIFNPLRIFFNSLQILNLLLTIIKIVPNTLVLSVFLKRSLEKCIEGWRNNKNLKCVNSGFTLIEITIGIALSSIVSLTLYNMLSQTTKVVENVTSFTNLDNKVAILYNQMDKTISTAFAPRIEDVKSTLSTETVTLIKPASAKATAGQAKKQQIEKLFFSENDGANLKLLTFLSTGAVRGYDETGSNITRVVYRLVKDEQNPGFYKLLIQQNSKLLDLDILKSENSKTRSYELATGIKKLKISYFAREENQEGEKNIKRTKLADWGSKEMLEKYKQKLPEFVELDGEIWDDSKKRSQEIKFKFNIFGYIPLASKTKEEKTKTNSSAAISGQTNNSVNQEPAKTDTQQPPATKPASSNITPTKSEANNIPENLPPYVTYQSYRPPTQIQKPSFDIVENLNLPNFWPES